MANIIEIKNVKKSFGKDTNKTEVLKGVNLNIEKGDFVSLMGASGSGKSTLLYLIGGLDKEFEGDILIDGSNISKLKEKEMSKIRLSKIGFIFQFYNLVQNLSVEDNIMLPVTMSGKSVSEYKKKMADILEIVGLSDKRKSKPSQLSGGQQQRVAIARAILGEPEILLADEATGNLDTVAGAEIMELFKKINDEKKITILQVTHSEKCASYGKRIVKMENGLIISE